ncbi:MAG: tRNA uridine-5-carboxymethylaminomethyl(34) synthesis GTPase MnmE [Fidelibacterota bacterium]
MISSDTIVACATPYGFGGIAVVRISGENAVCLAEKVCNNNSPLKNRKAALCSLYTKDGDVFDDAIITAFLSPNSYTGENVAEISCHGNPAIVYKLINILIEYGARMAEPGEFTRRAFINGKLDLVQVEAVSALIHSNSEKSVFLNRRILSGSLSKRLNEIKTDIMEALSFVEFELDISEEELVNEPIKKTINIARVALKRLNKLSDSFNEGRLINRGANIVIIGNPNVGKSTLLNALLEENRAIVSEEPGTTRDVLDAHLIYDGIGVTITDTAGIRETDNHIEKEGVSRAINKAREADLVIHVIDAADRKYFDFPVDNTKIIKVFNKADLLTVADKKRLFEHNNTSIILSAFTGEGIVSLKKAIKDALHTSSLFSEETYLITHRQHNITQTSIKSIDRAIDNLNKPFPPLELVSIDLREALTAIDQMLGKTTSADILNNIFGQFCVGK